MATKVRDYTKLASDIIQEVGGKDNIINATRCATRLRLVLKETADDAKTGLENFRELLRSLRMEDSSR